MSSHGVARCASAAASGLEAIAGCYEEVDFRVVFFGMEVRIIEVRRVEVGAENVSSVLAAMKGGQYSLPKLRRLYCKVMRGGVGNLRLVLVHGTGCSKHAGAVEKRAVQVLDV